MAREYKTRISQAIEAFATERQDRGFCAADVSVYLDEWHRCEYNDRISQS